MTNLTEKDNKAELALIVELHGKSKEEKETICELVGIPWEEYQRLLRKWSRVIMRWNKEKGEDINGKQ